MYNLKQDDKYIYIENIHQIIDNFPLFNNSRYGSNSNIYSYGNDKLLKIISERISISKMNLFDLIKEIKTQSIIKPDKYILIDEWFSGYSMNKAKGNVILNINPSIKYDDFINSLISIESDIKKLSQNQIITNDINCFNIIFDEQTKKSKLIDIDNYIHNKKESKELIAFKNLIYLYESIFYIISIGKNLNFNYNSNLFKYIINLINTKIYFDNNISFYFEYIKRICEDTSNRKINTIKDLRKILKYY